MNFKEQAELDISRVFFNADEFSDQAIIDGYELTVQIDDDQLKHRAEKEYFGITTGMLLYFTATSSFSERPGIGDRQLFNHKMYWVEDVREHAGVYEILLNQNRGE